MPLLDIHNLTVEFKTGSGWFRAVDNVSLTVDKGWFAMRSGAGWRCSRRT